MKGKSTSKIILLIVVLATIFATIIGNIGIDRNTNQIQKGTENGDATRNQNWNPEAMGLTAADILDAAKDFANKEPSHIYTSGCIGFVNEVITKAANKKGKSVNLINTCSGWGSSTINGRSVSEAMIISTTTGGKKWFYEAGETWDKPGQVLQPGDVIVGQGHAMIYIGQASSSSVACRNIGLNNITNTSTSSAYLQYDSMSPNYNNSYWLLDVNGNNGTLRLSNYDWSAESETNRSGSLTDFKVYRFVSYSGSYGMRIAKKNLEDPDGDSVKDACFQIGYKINNSGNMTYIWRPKMTGDTPPSGGANQDSNSKYYTYSTGNQVDYVTGDNSIKITNTSQYDYFTVKELEAPNGMMITGNNKFGLKIYKGIISGHTWGITKIVITNADNNDQELLTVNKGSSGMLDINLTPTNDSSKGIVKLEIANNGGTFNFIWRDKPNGKYNMYIAKDGTDAENLPNAKFDVTLKQNGELTDTRFYTGDNVDNGVVTASTQAPLKNNKSNNNSMEITDTNPDVYTITETVPPTGYAITNPGQSVNIQLNKKITNNGYEIDSIQLEGDDSTKVVAPEDPNETGWLRIDKDGNVTGSETDYWIAMDFHRGKGSNPLSSAIGIRYKNPKVEYSLDITKKDKNTGNTLADATFTVDYYKNTKVEDFDDKIYYNATQGNIANAKLEDLANENINCLDEGSHLPLTPTTYHLKSLGNGGSVNTDNNASNPPITIRADTSNNTQDIMEIKEINTPEGYRKILNSIVIAVHKSDGDVYEYDSEGNYKIKKLELLTSTGRSRETPVYIEEGQVLNIDANGNVYDGNPTAKISFNGNKISIEWLNPQLKGDYNLYIKKVNSADSNRAIQGVRFKVNGAYTEYTNSNGIVTYAEDIPITNANYNTKDTYEITEVDLGSTSGLITLDESVTVYVSKKKSNDRYIVDKATFDNEGTQTEREVRLKDGSTATATVDVVNGIVTVTIPNTIKGEYNLKIGKKSTRDNKYIETNDSDYIAGATFEVTQYLNVHNNNISGLNDSQITGTATVTSEAGHAVDVAFNNTTKIDITDPESLDIYKIKETQQPTGFAINSKTYCIIAYKKIDSDNNKYVVERFEVYEYYENDRAQYHLMYAGTLKQGGIQEGAETLWCGTYGSGKQYRADLDPVNGTIKYTGANDETREAGTYSVKVEKLGTDNRSLGGVKFTARRKINSDTTYGESFDVFSSVGTSVPVGDTVTIDKDYVTNTDKYEITEVDIGSNSGYYLGITTPIELVISKESVLSVDGRTRTNRVTGVTMNITGETVTRISDYKSTITLSNGTVVTVAYNENTKEITLTVKNPQQEEEGTYNVYLIKKGIDGTQLGGVKFTAKRKAGSELDNSQYTDLYTQSNPLVTYATSSVKVGDTITIDGNYISDSTPDEFILNEFDIGYDIDHYIGTTADIKLKVYKKSEVSPDSSTITNSVKGIDLEVTGATTNKISDTESEVTFDNGTKINVHMENDINIILTVENPKVTEEGRYKFNLIKKGTDDVQLGGFNFTAKNKVNGAQSYTQINSISNPLVTSATEAKQVGNEITIDKDKVSTDDEWVLREFYAEGNDDYYIGLSDDIKVLVKKESVLSADGKVRYNRVTGVELEIEEKNVNRISGNESEVVLDNGTVVNVKFVPDTTNNTGTVTLTVKNPRKTEEGNYKLQYRKISVDGTQLGGVKFTAKNKVNGATSYNVIADENTPLSSPASGFDQIGGTITIDKEHVGTADEWVLKEFDIGNNNQYFIGIPYDIKVEVTKASQTSSDGSKIINKVTGAKLFLEGENVTKITDTEYTVGTSSGYYASVRLEFNHSEQTISITVKNPTITERGSYHVYLAKQNPSGAYYPGVCFTEKRKINGDSDYTVIYDEEHPFRSGRGPSRIDSEVVMSKETTDTPDEYVVKEFDIGGNNQYYIGINKEIKVIINKESIESEDGSVVTNIVKSIDLRVEGEEDNITRISDQKSKLELENGTEVVIELINGNTINIIVKNPSVTESGSYKFNLVKKGTDGAQLGEVRFMAENKLNGAHDFSLISDTIYTRATTPRQIGSEVTIVKETINQDDEWKFREISLGSENSDYYIGVDKDIIVQVERTSIVSDDQSTITNKVSGVSLRIEGEESNVERISNVKSKITLENGAVVTVEYVDSTSTVTLTVENPKYTYSGEYKVQLKKVGTDGTQLQGVKFSAEGKFNGSEEFVKIPAENQNIISPATGTVSLIPTSLQNENGALTIDKDNYRFTDVIKLNEVSIENQSVANQYINGFEGQNIEIHIEKDRTLVGNEWKHYIRGISLEVGGIVRDGNVVDTDDEFTITYTAPNSAQIVVKLIKATNTIDVIVSNPKKTSFKVNLIKRKYNVDEDNNGADDPLEGAVFNVTINDGTSDIKTVTNQTTNARGEIPEISGINISAAGLTYTITVEEVSAPSGYIGLAEPVVFTAKSKYDGDKYILDTAVQPTIDNEYIQAEVSENEILIEAENRVEPIIHKGVKTVENQDSGYDKNEIQNWVINTSVPAGIEDYTKYIVTDTIDPEKTNNAEKRIAFINEANPASNVVVKYKGTNTVLTEGTDYKVSFDTTTKKLTVTFINVTDGADSFIGGRNLTEDTVLEITYKTQFTLNTNGDPIGLNQRIPNKAFLDYNANGSENKQKESEEPEVHVGGLGVYKYDKSTNQALAGAKFRLVKSEAEAEAAVEALWSDDVDAINNINWVKKYNTDGTEGDVWEVTTNSDGYAYFAGLKFGGDASESEDNKSNNGKGGSVVYEYDWQAASTKYYLVETYVPENYVLLEEVAEVKYNNFDITDLTTYHSVGNEVVVPEGEYGVEIAKYGRYQEEGQEKELHPIAGVVFSAKRTVNGGSQENLGNLTATDSTGRTLVGSNVVIDKDQVATNDEYIIKEESVPADSEYYVGLTKDIHLTVSKQSVKSEDKKKWINSVTGISMTIEGETVTEVVAGKKYTATVTKDGQALDITAELLTDETRGQYIKLTVENPHKIGEFPLHLVKTIKGTNPAQKLANAGFKISIKKGTEFVKDGNGNAINGTSEYFTDGNGSILIEGIKINRPNETFTVEVEETTVPNGYIGIPNKFTYTVTSVIDGNKLSLRNDDELVVTNDILVNVEDGEIWNYVENKPEPVIHKGVKTVENQDSGYDGDEVQTWVINTTVPAGIEDYTKYIVTDTIDPEIANNDEKRIEFLGLNTIHVYLKGNTNELVQGEDYLASFDDTTKTMTITFIDGDFKKGQDIPENSIIEIFYNTKFRLDSNGLIIGLNQSIPNQAHLTFNGNGKVEKTKDSETPEVHTGAVGVVKYEDVNKNGVFDSEDKVLEGAHFKIVRSEEEAQRALRAVLANDEATLSTINFVKVRDAEGNPTATDVELVTGADGTATYEGLEFGKDATDKESNKTNNGVGGSVVYEYDWETAKSEYYLVETEAPEEYYLLDHTTKFEVSKNSFVRLDLSKYYKEANKPKVYDLSLRKFITHVNGEDRDGNVIDRNITDRIPRVTLTDEFKDKENDEVTTAKYEHTKEPVIVQQGNTVTYTIRVYNEGPEDAYASLVKDDIPDGVKFIPYAEGDGSVNDEYRWKLVDENDNEVSDITKAKYIVTDYLSMEQGEIKDGVNENLIKGFDSDTMTELDYRDLKVQFLVIEPNTSERIITNYAQISDMTNSKGNNVKDRDSTPNEWIEGEDDQDIENIRLLYFDLALRKWVTKAIVTTDGEQKVFETGHKAEDNPEDVVKVDLKKSKLDKVVVKFEYQIRITNEGRIGGWCEEITDHIPDGLVFEQADNPIWAVVDDKTIVTDALKNTYLEPGESAEVTVVLRWVNSGDNLGIKVNVAEISKDRNEYGVHDIDSTPGNYKWGEDDIDDAPVMLAITTGNRVIGYVALGLVVVSIIAAGAVAIKKVRNETQYF